MDAISAILDAEPDMCIVARLDGGADLAASVRALQPDVVVLQEDGQPRMGNHAVLFVEHGGIKVVTVAGTSGLGALYRMGERPVLMRQPSAAQFVGVVRGKP
jgi:chemotaxis response regulator CheB